MIEISNIDAYGFEAAVRGMRNPMNSWEHIDSGYVDGAYLLGPKDLDLMHRLYVAGPEHRKYMRMIIVTMDINAPLYWWKEMDTYKVGTVGNSCSTMHKIHAKEFSVDDFSYEHLFSLGTLRMVIEDLNDYRRKYVETKHKDYWWQMIQLLPSSYNQKRTIQMNYEVADRIVRQRAGHKLDEWTSMVNVLESLPYAREIKEGV